jgi:hypothetical protein
MFDEYKTRVMGKFEEPEISHRDIDRLAEYFIRRSLRYYAGGGARHVGGARMPMEFYRDLAKQVIELAYKFHGDKSHSLKSLVAIIIGPEIEKIFSPDPREARPPQAILDETDEKFWKMMEEPMLTKKDIESFTENDFKPKKPRPKTEIEEFNKALKKL